MKFLLLLLHAAPIGAQTLGGFEPFTRQANGESWAFYDYATDDAFNAPWNLSNAGDPEIYATFTQDSGVSLFADIMSSGGIFVGNYADAGIDTILCDVFIEDINTFGDIEFFMLAGDTFYYSDYYVIEQSGWIGLENSLSKDQWHIFDEDDQEFVAVSLTPAILSDISEIGLNFYPTSTAADGRAVGLDNFTLLPDLTAPEVAISTQGSAAQFTFNGIKGIEYTIQTSSDLQEGAWTNVGSPFETNGESSTMIPTVNKGFFRLLSQPFYIEAP